MEANQILTSLGNLYYYSEKPGRGGISSQVINNYFSISRVKAIICTIKLTMGTGFKLIDGVASDRGRSPCILKQEEVETEVGGGESSKELRIFRSRLYLLMYAANLFCTQVQDNTR